MLSSNLHCRCETCQGADTVRHLRGWGSLSSFRHVRWAKQNNCGKIADLHPPAPRPPMPWVLKGLPPQRWALPDGGWSAPQQPLDVPVPPVSWV